MYFPQPQAGMVLQYSYLWMREHITGQEEGRKDRPVVIVLSTEVQDDEFVVTVVPVTTSPPQDPKTSIEVPAQTKKRLGLDSCGDLHLSGALPTIIGHLEPELSATIGY